MSTPSYGGSNDMSERAAGLTDAASRQFDRALPGLLCPRASRLPSHEERRQQHTHEGRTATAQARAP